MSDSPTNRPDKDLLHAEFIVNDNGRSSLTVSIPMEEAQKRNFRLSEMKAYTYEYAGTIIHHMRLPEHATVGRSILDDGSTVLTISTSAPVDPAEWKTTLEEKYNTAKERAYAALGDAPVFDRSIQDVTAIRDAARIHITKNLRRNSPDTGHSR